jgi:gamma-glutamyltranspeptidase/glutathione hydrolase
MVIAKEGIVATSQVLASQAGAMILAEGGSAVDAAIAANAVLGVVEPAMDGIGGDLFVLYRDAATGKLFGLNAAGWAPKTWTREYFTSRKLQRMPSGGIDSVTVPGCVDGWQKMHQRFGRLPWKRLFDAAIHYAEQGFPLQEQAYAHWQGKRLAETEESRRVFLPSGKPPEMGETFRNPGLGKALRLVASEGAGTFYKGEIARAILETSRKLGGGIQASDLAEYSSEWVEPISTEYRGWRVFELPPNGQGMAALLMLNLMERFTPGMTTNHPAWMHTKIESMKLAYADLAAYVADPKFVRVPMDKLLNKNYAAKRSDLIDPGRANCSVAAGVVSSDTTYLAAVDREGNIASWIQSVSGSWGSGVVAEGMGFHLHNRGSGFRLDASHPNVVAPRKRPFHTIIPGYMEKGDWRVGFGIMSGANQPLAHAQFVSNMVDHGMNLQAALEAPRFTKGSAQGCDVTVESRIGKAAIAELTKLGHKPQVRGEHSTRMGRGNAVMRNAKTGVNYGASDSRADGAAIPQPVQTSN